MRALNDTDKSISCEKGLVFSPGPFGKVAPYPLNYGISLMWQVEPLMWIQTPPRPRPPIKPSIEARENTKVIHVWTYIMGKSEVVWLLGWEVAWSISQLVSRGNGSVPLSDHMTRQTNNNIVCFTWMRNHTHIHSVPTIEGIDNVHAIAGSLPLWRETKTEGSSPPGLNLNLKIGVEKSTT